MTPVTGTPDFNQNISTNPTSPLFDTGEGANHNLMGGGSQSRAGRWLFATGFEDQTLNQFLLGLDGPGVSTIGFDTAKSFQGDKSLKLNAGTAVDYAAYFNKYFLIPGSNQGMEMYIAVNQLTMTPAEIHFTIRSGGHGVSRNTDHVGVVVIVITNSTDIKIYHDVNGSRTLIKNISSYWLGNTSYWHYFKMVFNTETNILSRVTFDDDIINVNAVGYSFVPGVSLPAIQFGVKLYNKQLGSSYSVDIDNYILTSDEP